MKKIVRVIPFIVAIFLSVVVTHAYYQTSTELPAIFKTNGYTFKLNGGGGTFDSTSNVVVLNDKTTLPTPKRNPESRSNRAHPVHVKLGSIASNFFLEHTFSIPFPL